MNNQLKPDIIAKIILYPEQKSGIKRQTRADYFETILSIAEKKFTGRILLDAIGSIGAGDTVEAAVVFLSPKIAREYFIKNAQFTVWEINTIGEGTVLKVCDT